MSHTVEMFFIIVCLSFVFTTLLSKIPLLRIPSSVGYLLFGILLQSHSVQLSSDEVWWLTELGNVGLLFLMFLSGMEVEVSQLKPHTWRQSSVNPMYVGLSMFLGTLLMSFGCAWALAAIFPGPVNPWMVTLLFATTSLGVILPILEETGVLHSDYGQVLLLSALIADLLTMLLISLFISAKTTGDAHDFLMALAVLPLGILAYAALRWMKSTSVIRAMAGDLQARIRAMIALVAAFCAFANFTGAEPIIGSFLVGMLVSAIPFAFKSRLRDYCHGVGYGLLIPIFFISVGLNFDKKVLTSPSSWLWVPILLCIAFLVKLVPALQLRRHFGSRAALGGGLLMSSRLSLIVASAEIGVRIGALPRFLSDAILIVAVLTCLLAPVSFVSLIK